MLVISDKLTNPAFAASYAPEPGSSTSELRSSSGSGVSLSHLTAPLQVQFKPESNGVMEIRNRLFQGFGLAMNLSIAQHLRVL